MDPYVLDIDYWVSVFPLSEAWRRLGDFLEAARVTCPRNIAHWEQYRDRVARDHDLGHVLGTDVYIFGKGEPDRPDATKIGGRPYRPRREPWPLRRDGEPMTFVAQYNFVDSHDLVGNTPGEVLLVFAESDEAYLVSPGEAPEGFCHFEWYPIGLDDLIEPNDVPPGMWRFVTCYGVRHRTIDYAGEDALRISEEVIASDSLSTYARECAERLCHLPGIKIAGVPAWQSYGDVDTGRDFPGRFLCSLSAVQTPQGPYPWVNAPAPAGDHVYREDLTFIFGGDDAIINFSIDTAGKMHWYR